jgi:endogenous inhibitor of DNA gyrase (YacG/DUF329 family)
MKRLKRLYNCPICNKEFIDYLENPQRKYCSHACYGKALKNGDYDHIFEKKRKNKFKCAYCGKNILKGKRRKRNGDITDNVFCNIECYRIFHAHKYKDRVCKYCGKHFDERWKTSRTTNEFCSNDCMRKFRAMNKMQFCIICGQAFFPFAFEKSKNRTMLDTTIVTCSDKCKKEYHRRNEEVRRDKISMAFTGDKHPNWQGGRNKYRGANCTCQRCGLKKREIKKKYGSLPEVHHIKPYREFNNDWELANRLDNLTTLCPSCHMLTEWECRRASNEN